MNRETELEASVHKLTQERNLFEAILENMKAAVITYNAEQIITLVNRSATEMLQLETAPVGMPIFDLVQSQEMRHLITKVQGGESSSAEFTLEDPHRQLLVRATPLQASGGGILVLHDITALRRLETVRRDFVANVSHELRTPVSIIRANAETLLEGAIEEPEVAKEFLQAMVRHAERLSNLVSDLLDISRIEAGEYQLMPQKISLAKLIENACDTVNAMMHNKQLTVSIELESDLRVTADIRALEHVMLNLLDNAIKYTPEQGHLTIRAFTEGKDFIRVEVQDNGPGIDPKHRSRIFERFYRVDKGRSRHMGGTGLGLAIVKHLTESMGGKVGVAPAAPHGSIFWFSLPVQERPTTKANSDAPSPLQVPPSTSQGMKSLSRKS